MKEMRRVLALVLCFVMLLGVLPVGAFAAEAETAASSEVLEVQATEAAEEESEIIEIGSVSAEAMGVDDALDENLDDIDTAMERARAYIDALTINNSSNDPETVVKNFGTHFTWDNEKRESSKSYLFDWSYYNGVVFEGLEYLYEATGDEAYKDYVLEYMSSLITSSGSWATCSNNSSKQCAGYDSTHGADCYKTASLLLDAYEMSGDSRYLTMAETLYADLDTAAKTYLLSNAGSNFRHTWATDPTPDLWLDGLYMILPFRAEYAKYIGDTEELDLIVSRLQWVSDNMYNSEKGLFYHAADSASSNSGTYWLRSIGWYAAALVDVMDSMEGENLETMKAQLVKLVDGMVACQNGYGMWLNNMAASESSTNPYETSGTALVCYAIMKAVNEGWLDAEYADAALLALQGITTYKLDTANANLTDICFKGVPSGSNSTFYDNEGKGVGPFIMLYAEIVEYFGGEEEEEVPVNEVQYECQYNGAFNGDLIIASGKGLTGVTAVVDESVDYSTIFDTNNSYGAYAVTLDGYIEGETVELTLSICNVLEENLAVYEIVNGVPTEITDYVTSAGDGFLNVAFDITAASGTYAIGTRVVTIPEDAVLTKLEIISEPAQKCYFVENISTLKDLPLDITGLVVEATYANETESVTKTIYWNEFDETRDGYGLTFDMSVLGEQDVVVSYTYGGVTLTDTFGIEIVEKVYHVIEIPEIEIELTVPSHITVTVVDNTEDETVKSALKEILTTYISYDFTLDGYTQGDAVKLTLPLPEGEGVGVAYYVPADGSAPEKITNAVDNGDGTITFTTDHFSTYATGRAAPVSGEGTLVGGTVYELATSITAGEAYLIVNTGSDGTGYALTNDNAEATSTEVTISDGQITLTEDASNMLWTFGGTNSGTVSNNGRYVVPGNNTLSLSTSGTTLTISNQNNGAYRIYRGRYYYLRYNNNSWTGSRVYNTNSIGSVYLYAEKETIEGGEVVFTVTPASSTTIMPNGTVVLNATVTVDGKEVDLSTCTITWASDDEDVATVTNGTVTGVTDGTANITAVLSHVGGKELKEPIELSIAIAVESKQIVDVDLPENSVGNVTRGATKRATTGDMLTVTYDDGTTEEVPVTLDMVVGDYDVDTVGTYENLSVTYGGKTFPYTLNVNPKEGNNYPDYPDPGSVKVNKTLGDMSKFQETGVIDIELSTSGIPIKTGVNALLIMDISNSMSWDDTEYDYNDTAIDPDSNQRLNISRESAKEFAKTLLVDYADGTPTNNTVSILAFAGIDGDYNDHSTASANDDVYQLGALAMKDVNAVDAALDEMVKATTGGTNYDYAFQQAYEMAQELYELNGQMVHIVFMTDGAPTHYNGVYYKSRSNTDLTALMNYVDPATGETSRYTSTGNDRNGNDIDSTATQSITVYYNDGTTGTKTVTYNKGWSDYIINNKNGWAEKTKSLEDIVAKVYSIGFGMKNGSVTQGATSSMPTLNNVNGGQYYIPASTTRTVLQHVASTAADYYEADNTEELTALYKSLASQIKQAATEAYFVDQMGDSFNLQLASFVMKRDENGELVPTKLDTAPVIEVLNYNIYKASDVGTTINGVEVTEAMVGERYGTGTEVETVTFADNFATVGNNGTAQITAAYSSVGGYTLPDGTVVVANTTNILVDDVICAKNFYYNTSHTTKTITLSNGETYDLPAETFYWNIGTISEIEWVLHYYVYLEGSMEGKAAAGSYATNNYAILYYKNWLDNDAEQDTTSPSGGWEAANVSYAFYLVDQNGNPVVNQTTGQTGSFYNSVKVTQPVVFQQIMLNNLEEINTIEASSLAILPEGYELYDNTASYKVVILSEDGKGSWTITYDDENKVQSSYVTGHYGTYASNEPLVTSDQTAEGMEDYNLHEDYDYTHTTVWFAVVWIPKAIPDAVVIDYGLPVDISVLVNDQFGNNGKLNGIGTTAEMESALEAADTDGDGNPKIYTGAHYDGFGTSETLTYGTAKVNGSKVTYTPNTMAMNGYDQFAYEVEYDFNEYDENGNHVADRDTQYYYGDVTVIPATTVYYEDTFQANTVGGITYAVSEGDPWAPVGSQVENATQQEDRPGEYSLPVIDANNVYGYDKIYSDTNSAKYSLGSAMKVNLSGMKNATATFQFYGTGFDVISKTSGGTGTIIVDVCPVNEDGSLGTAVRQHIVDTYYGYAYGEYVNDNGETVTGWHPVSNSDADADSIFQVPVMRVTDLEYGHYNVVIKAAYDVFFDHSGEGNYDFYLDAIRIYNPAGSGTVQNGTIQNAYEMDKEGWPLHIEMRDEIIRAEDFTAGESSVNGMIFIDNVEKPDGAEYSISDYQNYGPNNELYLAPGQSVAFQLDLAGYIKPADTANNLPSRNVVADVQVSAKSVGTTTAKVTLSNTFASGIREFNTASAMNYSIKSYLDLGTDTTNENNDSVTTLIFTNSGDTGIVSFTNIKIVFSENPYGTATNGLLKMTAPAANAVLMMLNAPKVEAPEIEETEPEVTEPEETEPEVTEPEATEPEEVLDADLKVSIRSKSVKVGETVVVMATTSSDVDALTVNGKEVTKYVESRLTGKRTWTTTVKATKAGKMDVEVTAFSADGEALETAVETIKVQQKSVGIVQQIIGTIIGVLFR